MNREKIPMHLKKRLMIACVAITLTALSLGSAQAAEKRDSFRIAWTLQYVVWSVAVVGILVTRRKARRLLRLQDDRSLLEGIEK